MCDRRAIDFAIALAVAERYAGWYVLADGKAIRYAEEAPLEKSAVGHPRDQKRLHVMPGQHIRL
jgi:hypothetical protein